MSQRENLGQNLVSRIRDFFLFTMGVGRWKTVGKRGKKIPDLLKTLRWWDGRCQRFFFRGSFNYSVCGCRRCHYYFFISVNSSRFLFCLSILGKGRGDWKWKWIRPRKFPVCKLRCSGCNYRVDYIHPNEGPKNISVLMPHPVTFVSIQFITILWIAWFTSAFKFFQSINVRN